MIVARNLRVRLTQVNFMPERRLTKLKKRYYNLNNEVKESKKYI